MSRVSTTRFRGSKLDLSARIYLQDVPQEQRPGRQRPGLLPFEAGISARLHRTRRGAVAADQPSDIEPRNGAIDHGPSARDHHPVGAMRAAQHERGYGIAMAGE